MQKVAIIGAGVVGTTVGYLLKKKGYSVVGISSRRIESAERARRFIGEGEALTDNAYASKKADIVFITTPDNFINAVCRKIKREGGFNPGVYVFHMSGALSSEVLSPARKAGAKVASIHPLQSLADVNEAVKNLPGSYFCIEGDEGAVPVAKKIVSALRGKEIKIGADKKPLYHAGASAASNFLVSTVRFAMELFDAAGVRREDSLNALMPLIKGTVANIEDIGIPHALTGPISRGDTGVIEDHLKAIKNEKKGLMRLYSELGRYTVGVALEKGSINKREAKKIISLVDRYQEKGDRI